MRRFRLWLAMKIAGDVISDFLAKLEADAKDMQNIRGAIFDANRVNADLSIALDEIRKCETPGANGTVKRMARIASQALEAAK